MDQRNLLKWDGGGELQEESLAWARAWKQSVGRVCAQGMPSPQPAWCVWSGGLTSQVEGGLCEVPGKPWVESGDWEGEASAADRPQTAQIKKQNRLLRCQV